MALNWLRLLVADANAGPDHTFAGILIVIGLLLGIPGMLMSEVVERVRIVRRFFFEIESDGDGDVGFWIALVGGVFFLAGVGLIWIRQ